MAAISLNNLFFLKKVFDLNEIKAKIITKKIVKKMFLKRFLILLVMTAWSKTFLARIFLVMILAFIEFILKSYVMKTICGNERRNESGNERKKVAHHGWHLEAIVRKSQIQKSLEFFQDFAFFRKVEKSRVIS